MTFTGFSCVYVRKTPVWARINWVFYCAKSKEEVFPATCHCKCEFYDISASKRPLPAPMIKKETENHLL